MTILNRIDAWLGKTLFHPPIILLCQVTRQSQYAIYRAMWFLVACHATYFSMRDGSGWGWLLFVWFWTITTFISASIYPDRPVQSWGGFRVIMWIFLVIGVMASSTLGYITSGTVRNIMILFAEYAATIKTIPPRKTREKRVAGKEALDGQ